MLKPPSNQPPSLLSTQANSRKTAKAELASGKTTEAGLANGKTAEAGFSNGKVHEAETSEVDKGVGGKEKNSWMMIWYFEGDRPVELEMQSLEIEGNHFEKSQGTSATHHYSRVLCGVCVV